MQDSCAFILMSMQLSQEEIYAEDVVSQRLFEEEMPYPSHICYDFHHLKYKTHGNGVDINGYS